MIGYLIFGITLIIYIALSSFVLQPAPRGGDYTIGYAYAAFTLITALYYMLWCYLVAIVDARTVFPIFETRMAGYIFSKFV